MRHGDSVQIAARRVAAAGPERLVPTEAGDPFARGTVFYISANVLLKFGERLYAAEINGEFGERGLADVHVRVVESWQHERATHINDACVWAEPRIDVGSLGG